MLFQVSGLEFTEVNTFCPDTDLHFYDIADSIKYH